jgi:hypothetical protein
MNEQFSMLYTLLFLSAIIGSFIALKASIEYWADYEIFSIDSDNLMSSLELIDYFDDYSNALNFSANLTVIANSSAILLLRDNYYKSFDNSVNLNNINITGKDFFINKTLGGLSLI